ncbi:hypothetical protein AB0K68_01345 [Streptomyces sp. NPDC050698]
MSNTYTDGSLHHLVTDGEDRLKGTGYLDTSHSLSRTNGTHKLDGRSSIDSANRLRVIMPVDDHALLDATRIDDSYQGDATFTLGVPREDRHAVATTSERYRPPGPRRVLRPHARHGARGADEGRARLLTPDSALGAQPLHRLPRSSAAWSPPVVGCLNSSSPTSRFAKPVLAVPLARWETPAMRG